jgi:hypothetical protein
MSIKKTNLAKMKALMENRSFLLKEERSHIMAI